jgi:GNAT acetyltransferase
MFTEVTEASKEQFKLIYHQTTAYLNPIIETVLYENNRGKMYFYGDLLDRKYLIFHRSGFAHINLDAFDETLDTVFFQELDAFIRDNPDIPNYFMFYHTPAALLHYWKEQEKKYFKIRTRRRYQIDRTHFMKLEQSLYAVPPNHQLISLQQSPWKDLESFNLSLDSKFYDSREQFLQNSFGFVLYNEDAQPVSMSYLICQVGRNSECDLKTLPAFRNKGYGYITITNYVRESFLRGINVGWDCFVDNHTNKWVQQQYGYTDFREYDFVTFAK